MAVLPPQRTAPYLPAATLPPSARRGKAGAIESSGESSRAVPRSAVAGAETDSAGASWSKAVVLAAAVVVIGAFAWLVADRIGGVRQWWIVKFACVGWLIGMATATAMLSSGREGPLAKMLSIVAAALAIVLGKALILCLPQVPAELMHFRDAHEWARTFAKLAFIPVDPLFFAMAVTGSTVRFMLSKRDE